MQKVNSINLFKAFFEIGMILLGGGYVIVPVMEEILVKNRKWLTHEELVDFYCVAQCLPGIIAINTSILAGNRIMKFKGGIIAVFAFSLSPFVSIVLIAKFIDIIMGVPFIESIFWGVNISVIVLIYLALKDMWAASMRDTFCYIWFLVILFLSFLKVSPVVLILLSVVLGAIIQKAGKLKHE